LPLYFFKQKENGTAAMRAVNDQEILNLALGTIHVINPGSVGQPRDHDARASYGIFDSQALTFVQKRKAYDIAMVQIRMREQQLPPSLIDRLAEGI